VEGGSKRGHSRRETSGSDAKNSASARSSCWSDQIAASGAKAPTPWWRRDVCSVDEGQDTMACSKVCGASEHNRQELSASGLSYEG